MGIYEPQTCVHGNLPFGCAVCSGLQAQKRAAQKAHSTRREQDCPEAERVDDEPPKLLKGE